MAIQRLFVRRERKAYKAPIEGLSDKIHVFLEQAGFVIDNISISSMHGEQSFDKLGLKRTMDIWISDSEGLATVNVECSATLENSKAAVGLIGAVLMLPVAVVAGAVSYLDYDKDAEYLITSLWDYLDTNSMSISTKRCGNCGLELRPAARFCMRCGAQVRK